MIYIISGKQNSGKTTYIKTLHKQLGGDGFITEKIIENLEFKGYTLKRLKTNETHLFIVENNVCTNDHVIKNKRFSFYKNCFELAEQWIDEIINENISPIYIDEVGKLELNDKGFNNILYKLINSNLSFYITAREDNVALFLQKFEINNYKVIHL